MEKDVEDTLKEINDALNDAKPMTDEQIRRWQETGEGLHTDEIAEELTRLREENKQLKEGLDAIIDAPISDEYKRARELLKETCGLIPTTGWQMMVDLGKKIEAFLDGEE